MRGVGSTRESRECGGMRGRQDSSAVTMVEAARRLSWILRCISDCDNKHATIVWGVEVEDQRQHGGILGLKVW